MQLFQDVAPIEKQHPIYKLIRQPQYGPERSVLERWAEGFIDRDRKFVREFQTTFEPCLWELYLHAVLRELGADIDFSFHAPDFVVTKGQTFCVEATIAAPASGGKPAHGFSTSDLPEDFDAFNSGATLRICNSFTSKHKKYRSSYSVLPHAKERPFVIAIASFDQPFAHMAASRPILSALYGLYHDEALTISTGASKVISYNVSGVVKSETSDVPLGYFADPAHREVSAVIYSCLATWGKVRALAENPDAHTIYTTLHPNPNSLYPIVRQTLKKDYLEHLLDGLYVFHNPFASAPLDPATLAHPRIAQALVRPDGEIQFAAPDDFLLLRYLMTLRPKTDARG
jgi:hypothetical protein